MNFFKLYIGDYHRDTAHLSVIEHGAYLLMLQHFYATEKPLPTGKALHRMLRAQDKTERDAIDFIASKFWTQTETGIVNERAAQEIAKADRQRTVNRSVGIRGGRPKKTESVSKTRTDLETESVIFSEPINNPNQTPDTRQIQPPLPPPPGGGATKTAAEPPGFAEFWSAYPRKTAKPAALRAFRAQRINGKLPVILADVEQRKQGREWAKDGGQYIPHPATYLRQKRWEDGIDSSYFDQQIPGLI